MGKFKIGDRVRRTFDDFGKMKVGDIGVVRECLIEAMLRGVSVVGNQFNIIANRFYMTKEGWDQRLKNVGAYEVLLKIGTAEDISEMRTEKALKVSARFGYQASCKVDGKLYAITASNDGEVDSRVSVSAYARDAMDAIPQLIGKAEARALRRLYAYVCNVPEESDEPMPLNVIEPAAIEQQPVERGKRATAALNAIDGAESLEILDRIMRGVNTEHSNGKISETELTWLRLRGDARRTQLS